MKPTKHNPIARAVKAKKPSVVPSKKYEGPLVEDWESEGGKIELRKGRRGYGLEPEEEKDDTN